MQHCVDQRPILILSSGHRCGSTLVQRLLTSHPDVFVWGEHDGILGYMVDARERLRTWEATNGRFSRVEFESSGPQSFMANITPEPDAVNSAFRSFLEQLFAVPAAALGRQRWGFKEVRYGARQGRWLVELFPDVRIIHLTRDPWSVLSSLIRMEAKDSKWDPSYSRQALTLWQTINASFLDVDFKVLRLRFEDVTGDPGPAIEKLAEWCDIDKERISKRVLKKRIWSFGKSGAAKSIPREQLMEHPLAAELLMTPAFDEVARHYGYTTLGEHAEAARSHSA